jgi:hypothetical protein
MQSFDHMLLAWARKQPADATYSYFSCGECALARFLKDTGICDNPMVGGLTWGPRYGAWSDRSDISEAVRHALSDDDDGNTYGALADRLAAALVPA